MQINLHLRSLGRPEGVEPSIPVPQTGVLPLNYGHHVFLILFYIPNEMVTIMAEIDVFFNFIFICAQGET